GAIEIGSATQSESFSSTRPRLDVGTINADARRPDKCRCVSVCLSTDFNLVNLVLASQRIQGFANHFKRRQMVWTTLEIQHFDIHALLNPLLSFEHGAAARFAALLFQCSIAVSQIGLELGFKLLELPDSHSNIG